MAGRDPYHEGPEQDELEPSLEKPRPAKRKLSLASKLALGLGLALLAAGLLTPGLPGIGLMLVSMAVIALSFFFDKTRP